MNALRYHVFVNARLFGTTTAVAAHEQLILCALLEGVPSVTITAVR
jgi:hypothetical protein